MISYTPLEYLKIDVANMYGLDKKTFKQRIAWVNSVKDLSKYTNKADKPAQFEAARLALIDAENQVSTGHLVGLDACSSGITILGILTGCHVTSSNTGVIGTKRMDMYSVCANEMGDLLGKDIDVPRSDVKAAQMTYFYGSRLKPKEIFGDETEELFAFHTAQNNVAPGACMFMEELLLSWQPNTLSHRFTLPDNFNANVPVLQKMKTKIEIDELDSATLTYIYEDNVGKEKGLSVAANITHGVDGFIVRETARRCCYSKRSLTNIRLILHQNRHNQCTSPVLQDIEFQRNTHGFLSLVGAIHINKKSVLLFTQEYREELMLLIDEVLMNPSFQVITIHDEFKCHPNYMNYLRQTYAQVLAELAESLVGQRILQEVRNDDSLTVQKLSDDLGDCIRQGEYFLS